MIQKFAKNKLHPKYIAEYSFISLDAFVQQFVWSTSFYNQSFLYLFLLLIITLMTLTFEVLKIHFHIINYILLFETQSRFKQVRVCLDSSLQLLTNQTEIIYKHQTQQIDTFKLK